MREKAEGARKAGDRSGGEEWSLSTWSTTLKCLTTVPGFKEGDGVKTGVVDQRSRLSVGAVGSK